MHKHEVVGVYVLCRALQNLATLSNTYGAANCSLLKLYSNSTAAGGAAAAAGALPPAAFQACRHACMHKGGAGAYYPSRSRIPRLWAAVLRQLRMSGHTIAHES